MLASVGVHWLTDPFAPAFMQRALLELALLSVAAGALGAFVVLRRLAFATHALGVGAFPGAVVAYGVGASAFLGGLVSSLLIAGGLALLGRRRDLDTAAATGLLLAGALALGSLLVSDVFAEGARVDTLLFGSLLGVTEADVWRSVAVAGGVAVAALLLGRGWLLVAFDRESVPVLGFRPALLDLALTVVLAAAAVATVDAVGSLLVSALFVVPAATARLVARRVPWLVAGAAALALAESVVGLWLAYRLDAPPGATVAICATVAFAAVYAGRELRLPGRRAKLVMGGAAALAGALILAAGAGTGPARAATSTAHADQSHTSGTLRIVATTPLVADWVRAVGGGAVEVRTLLKPLVDPHEYEPGTGDAAAVTQAKLVVASGAGFDDWIVKLVQGAGGARVVALAPVARLRPPALARVGEQLDPHFWHDLTLAAVAIVTLRDALVAADPAAAAGFRSRAVAYLARLAGLDRQLRASIATVPAARRKLVTDHDAFGYLARRYGIRIVGAAIPSTSTAASANARDTARLIDLIRREHVATLFSESSVDPKLIGQVARETGARVEDGLYGDTLGPAGSGADSYVAMMTHNVRLLAAGLRGSAK